jgi:hypothetical protein
MRRGLAVLALGAATTLAGPAAAQGPQRIAPVSGSFTERLLDSVPHSGTRAVGMVHLPREAGESGKAGDYAVIHARADAPVNGTLCATVSSVDGRYSARGLYAVTSGPGTLQLVYPTARLRGAGYGPGELAVSVRLGERCADAALPLLPAGWQPVPDNGDVGFAVNAGAGAAVFTVANSQRQDCLAAAEMFRNREPAAFTHVCRVPASRLQPGGQVKVFREVAGARESEIVFPLLGAKPAT